MKRADFYLSTIDLKAYGIAAEHGFGVEIAEYCTAWNMDDEFVPTDASVRSKMSGIKNCTFHAPFNELFPCAIDRKAQELADFRYRQAISLAREYGAKKVVIHGGYNPWIYYPVWYVEKSILFWKAFLEKDPGVEIVLENVLETEPEMLLDIVKGVDDPRLKICLDTGHINAYSKIPVEDWLEKCAPCIGHFHVHNNDGSQDSHSALDSGSISMKRFLECAGESCPGATFALELIDAASSVQWLIKEKVIE